MRKTHKATVPDVTREWGGGEGRLPIRQLHTYLRNERDCISNDTSREPTFSHSGTTRHKTHALTHTQLKKNLPCYQWCSVLDVRNTVAHFQSWSYVFFCDISDIMLYMRRVFELSMDTSALGVHSYTWQASQGLRRPRGSRLHARPLPSRPIVRLYLSCGLGHSFCDRAVYWVTTRTLNLT